MVSFFEWMGYAAALGGEISWGGSTDHPFKWISSEMAEKEMGIYRYKGDWMIQLQEKICSCAAQVGQLSWFVVVRFLKQHGLRIG